jgi:nitrogen fixation/metabolism regulation signal transduction histidine kinase
LRRTIRDANRASEVIARLRALFGKKAPAMEGVDLNEAIREVVALAANEFQRDRVAIRSELATDLPSTQGDRWVSRSIIESNRGRIWAERNEGPGTTFGLWLPRVECSSQS